jgi:hypothetical protein
MTDDTFDTLETALRAQPLATLPRELHRNIMAQVRATRQPARFQLDWTDLALSLFFALVPIAASWGWAFLPRETGLYLRYYWMVSQSMNLEFFLAAGGLAILAAAFTALPFLRRDFRLW